MITTTTAFNTRLQEDSRTFKARFLNNGSVLDVGIKNITINKGACGETFSVGSVYSSYIEVALDECDEALENKELQLQIGLLLDDGSVEYLTMGYYTVTTVERTAYRTTFTAVGRISAKLNCLPEGLPESRTLANLAAAITETTGISITYNGVTLAGTIEEDLTGLTCKEILEVITAVLGGFATENGSGGIVISRFSTANTISCNGERTTTEPQFADYDYSLTGIKVVKTEEWEDEDGSVHPEVSFSQGTPRQNLSLKYMTQSLFTAFAENTVGFTYRPGTVPLALGDPRLEPWDTIKFTDVKGDVYIVPCMNITHSFDGGLSTTITAPGESESESETQSKGPLVKQLERVSSQLFTAEQAIVKRITADEADLRYATVESLNAAEANIENLSGSFASFKTGEFESLKASVVTTDTLEAKVGEFGYVKTSGLEAAVANVGFLTVLDAEAQYATITSLNATDAKITNLSAKAITTDNLSAKVAKLGYATVSQLEATEGKIDSLTSIAITTYNLSAKVGEFGYLTADDFVGDNAQFNYLKTDKLEAEVGKFGYLSAADFEGENARFDYLKVETAEITYATITQLEVVESEIMDNLEANYATISSLNATNATITSLSGDFTSFKNGEFENLKTNVATIEDAYMNEAAVDTLVVGKGYITTAQTNTLLSNYVKTTELSATNATVSSLSSDFASFKTSTTGTLESQEASIESLTANDAELETLIANKANVSSLNTANANISTLQSKVSDIEKAYISTASVNTLLADYVKTSKLTADYITSSQISAAYAKISDLTAATARIGTLETNTLKTADLSAEVAKLGYATADNLNAANARIDNLSSTYATVDLANVKNGSITTAMMGTGIVKTAQIADGSITAAKIVNLTADKITAGTLSVERLVIRGTEKSLVYALNNITGALQSQNVDTLNGEILTERSITTDKIVANAITSNEIAAAAINANKIAAGAVTADKLSVSTLSAISANLGTVTAGILQSENYQESDYLVDGEGNVTGSVLEGLRIDLNNKAYCTPQITIKDDYIEMRGYVTVGRRIDELGSTDHVNGANSVVIGSGIAEGKNSLAVGADSYANGLCSVALSGGNATGSHSFASGILAKSEGRSAHAEGSLTRAGGDESHAEGFWTRAYGAESHTEGFWTIAHGSCQHVQGKFNIEDKDGVYAHIVGNGTSNSALSNAHTLDWEGNAWYAGGITAATGTLEGELLFDTGTTQSATKGIRWSAINSRNPYIGYALNQSDGTFLIGSLLGTNYENGLAIGGGSGNLLWKGSRVATATDLSSYALNSHTHNYAGSSSAGGVANSATKLATARTINGVSFDGSGNITITANPTTTALSNVDLNNYKTPGFYSGGGSNGCSNRPSGVDSFGLIVFKNASGYICQMLVGGNQKTNIAYLRTCTGSSWTGWVRQYSTDNKPALTELGITATAAEVNVLDGITATVTELNYCDGVTSNIQTQLNGKAATHSHPYMSSSPVSIELNSTGSLSGYGGFIDFHYNGNTADYTSRIIENASGQLAINGVTITSGKVVTATTFVGSLNGNATSATKATQDGNGNVIAGTYLPLSGGTLTGNLTVGSASMETNGYVTGTWLKTTAASALTSAAAKIAVLDGSGWIYYRTPAQILSDIGAAASGHTHSYLPLSGGTLTGALAVNANLTTTGYFGLDTSRYVQCKDTNGTYHNILGINTNNNLLVGYGMRMEDSGVVGDTYIYGKDIRLVPSGTDGNLRPYWKAGDSVEVYITTAGFVSSSKQNIYFIVPLSKPIIGSPTGSSASVDGFILRQDGNYTHGTSSSTYKKPSSYTTTVYEKYIRIVATFSTTTNAVNNAPIGIVWSGKITFS